MLSALLKSTSSDTIALFLFMLCNQSKIDETYQPLACAYRIESPLKRCRTDTPSDSRRFKKNLHLTLNTSTDLQSD